MCAINSGCVFELLTADALRVSTYTSRMSCVTPRVAGHGLRQVMTGHAVSMLSQTAVFDMRGRLSVEFSSSLNRSADREAVMQEIYWDSHDVLVDVTGEIEYVKHSYNIPHLDHVPDCELQEMRLAVCGDLVKVKNGSIGIVVGVDEEYGQKVIAITLNSGRIITKRVR